MVGLLRDVWERDAPSIGGWCTIPSSFSAELMGRAGFDWVCIDTQHGAVAYDTMLPMLQALAITETPAFVRVPWNSPDHIMKTLDAGAQGVIIPMVNNRHEAEAAVAAAKYPPLGTRSWGPIRARFGIPGYDASVANDATVVAVMIETPSGMANLDDILSVPGVDAVYVGPADLGLGHGMEPTLSVTQPEHIALIEKIADSCALHGVVAGIHCDSVDAVGRWQAAGYGMFTVGSDAALMRQAAMSVVAGTFGGRGPAESSKGQYA